MSHNIIVVKRYDNPMPRFGIHSDERQPGVFNPVGLFSLEDARQFIKDHANKPYRPTLEEIKSCAPIEWHKLLKEGDEAFLERFTGFIVEQ